MPFRPLGALLATALAAALGLAGCSASATPGVGDPAGSGASAPAGTAAPGTLSVTAGFYPLAYLLEQIGGPDVTVTTLAKPGAEPHDTELTPSQVASLTGTRLVVTLGGFQPAVDQAVAQQAPDAAFDLGPLVSLDLTTAGEDGEGGEATGAVTDLHFWLDPLRYAAAGTAVAERLATIDPARARDFRSRATAFAASMGELDTAYSQGLATCASRTLVTAHAAFGYLATRYHLTQVPIAGLSPDREPSARKLGEIARLVNGSGVRTIYTETLVDPTLAETIANTTNARTAVLDPVEGITTASAGPDYPSVMRANLATLRSGQDCS